MQMKNVIDDPAYKTTVEQLKKRYHELRKTYKVPENSPGGKGTPIPKSTLPGKSHTGNYLSKRRFFRRFLFSSIAGRRDPSRRPKQANSPSAHNRPSTVKPAEGSQARQLHQFIHGFFIQEKRLLHAAKHGH